MSIRNQSCWARPEELSAKTVARRLGRKYRKGQMMSGGLHSQGLE